MTDDPAPDCACREGEPTANPRAPPSPTARCASVCDGFHKVSGDNPGLRLAVILFPGTSHERSISSRTRALFFERFAPFLPFSRRRPNASTSLSALVLAKSSSTISSQSSSGARGYGQGPIPHGRAQVYEAQERCRHEDRVL